MSLLQRMSARLRAKGGKRFNKTVDPRETLDSSYERQMALLQQVRRSVADVSTSRKRLELQGVQLTDTAGKLEAQARQAVADGREDVAREALTRRAGITAELENVATQRSQLDAEEQKLVATQQSLQARVEAFRSRKETIKANYAAAEAQVKIGEAVTGISDEMGNVGLAIEHAEEKTTEMQARAAAIDELLGSGSVEDLTAAPGSDLDARMRRIGTEGTVEAELSRIKGEVGAGNAPPAIEAGGPADG